MMSITCSCVCFPSPACGGGAGCHTRMRLPTCPLPARFARVPPRKRGKGLYPLRVEHRFLAGAVAAQRALVADRVGPLEDPVLPGGEAREDFRFHGLGSAE